MVIGPTPPGTGVIFDEPEQPRKVHVAAQGVNPWPKWAQATTIHADIITTAPGDHVPGDHFARPIAAMRISARRVMVMRGRRCGVADRDCCITTAGLCTSRAARAFPRCCCARQSPLRPHLSVRRFAPNSSITPAEYMTRIHRCDRLQLPHVYRMKSIHILVGTDVPNYYIGIHVFVAAASVQEAVHPFRPHSACRTRASSSCCVVFAEGEAFRQPYPAASDAFSFAPHVKPRWPRRPTMAPLSIGMTPRATNSATSRELLRGWWPRSPYH